MNEERQIEEMAKTMVDSNNKEVTDALSLFFATLAEALYKAGYRKQSENAVEVVRCKDCEYWTEVSFDAITELHWGECRKPLGDYRDCDTAEHDFCSYGEAKMKGGAE